MTGGSEKQELACCNGVEQLNYNSNGKRFTFNLARLSWVEKNLLSLFSLKFFYRKHDEEDLYIRNEYFSSLNRFILKRTRLNHCTACFQNEI